MQPGGVARRTVPNTLPSVMMPAHQGRGKPIAGTGRPHEKVTVADFADWV